MTTYMETELLNKEYANSKHSSQTKSWSEEIVFERTC